ncbi:MAG: energy transducer TonB [Zoogloea sp.]|nr:energy transducer TonB [Zoogloea sp.]
MTAYVLAPPPAQWRRAALLAAVFAAHSIGLWLAVRGFGMPPVTLPEPLPIMVDLLAQQASEQPRPLPAHAAPLPHPIVTPPHHAPRPMPAPAPQPVAATAPVVQQAPQAPAVVPSQAAAHPASPAPPALEGASERHPSAANAAPAPTTPARFDAAYLNNPAPVYPPLSRRLGEQGKVFLRVQVNPGGLPEEIELKTSSGSSRLDKAALETVRKWRFVPARQGDKPVTEWVLVPIVFKLEE